MIINCNSLDDTYKFAKKLANNLKADDIIFLNGDLGAGKTTLVKEIAKNLGIKETVTSPTFTLLKTYETSSFLLVHVDAYRLEGNDFDELTDYLNDNTVIFIEWASLLGHPLGLDDHLEININYVDETKRMIEINATGTNSNKLLEALND